MLVLKILVRMLVPCMTNFLGRPDLMRLLAIQFIAMFGNIVEKAMHITTDYHVVLLNTGYNA